MALGIDIAKIATTLVPLFRMDTTILGLERSRALVGCVAVKYFRFSGKIKAVANPRGGG